MYSCFAGQISFHIDLNLDFICKISHLFTGTERSSECQGP